MSEQNEKSKGLVRRLSGRRAAQPLRRRGSGMGKFLIRRLLAAIPVLFAIMLVTFTLSHLMPGGPFDYAGNKQVPEYVVRQLEQKFGLNKPVVFNTRNDGYYPDGDDWQIAGYHAETRVVSGGPGGSLIEKTEDVFRIDLLDSQFFNYIWGAIQGDFGPSLSLENRDHNVQVKDEITSRLWVSAQVGIFAVIFGFTLGIPLGVLAAIYHNTIIDYAAMFFAIFNQATPAIVVGPVLIIIFAVELNWVPVTDDQNQWQAGPEL
ncbi:MAG: ABC transporter permease, partial [Anaerolineae bacterium]|nr:ABC transporter permease [Anaerolineae bacterium]